MVFSAVIMVCFLFTFIVLCVIVIDTSESYCKHCNRILTNYENPLSDSVVI